MLSDCEGTCTAVAENDCEGGDNGLRNTEGEEQGIVDNEDDERCPICLSDFDNKAFLDNCFHILFIEC